MMRYLWHLLVGHPLSLSNYCACGRYIPLNRRRRRFVRADR